LNNDIILFFDLYTAKERQEIGFLKTGQNTRDKIPGQVVKVLELSIATGQNLTGIFLKNQSIKSELAGIRPFFQHNSPKSNSLRLAEPT
jgi:hypothetical protein